MTEGDLDRFSVAYRRLGSALLAQGKTITTEMLMEAFTDTRGFSLETVEAALDTLRRTVRFFPRPAQLLEACRDAAHVGSLDHGGIPSWVDPLGNPPRYFCDACQDTGFVLYQTCAGHGACGVPGCGKAARTAGEHPYTKKCTCRAQNPVLAYERAKLRRAPIDDRG
jgi:hypothetical protein